jgi:hypothetical protein
MSQAARLNVFAGKEERHKSPQGQDDAASIA